MTFPATLMGISILEPVLAIADEGLAEWLLRLPSCCGVTKSAPAEKCYQYAQRTIDLILEQRQKVLDGIRDRLVPHGFDVEATYQEWLAALHQIAELSAAADADCSWSAPSHPDDTAKSADIEGFMRKIKGE